MIGVLQWGREGSDESSKGYRPPLPKVYMTCQKDGLKSTGYSILGGIADHLLSHLGMWNAYMVLEYPSLMVETLYQLVIYTSCGEEVLKGWEA